MAIDTGGYRIERLEEATRTALQSFVPESGYTVEFDLERAPVLELTPEKPYLARSVTAFKHLGEVAGNLYVIAFGPGDGTGDESTYTADQLRGSTGGLPLLPRAIPRSKAGIHSEVCLALASVPSDEEIGHPVALTGSLTLVGIDESYRLTHLGVLGQTPGDFMTSLKNTRSYSPVATLTTGTVEGLGRIGDPHAVYNLYPAVQVFGFMAVSGSQVERHASLSSDLRAKPPKWYMPVESPEPAATGQ